MGLENTMSKNLTFSIILLSLFLTKLLITQVSIGDSIAFLGLAGLFGFIQFMESKKEIPVNDKVKSDLDSMKKDLVEVKNFIAQTKISGKFTSR